MPPEALHLSLVHRTEALEIQELQRKQAQLMARKLLDILSKVFTEMHTKGLTDRAPPQKKGTLTARV